MTVTAARSAVKRADPLYAPYALILVLDLHRGEMLGLKWEDVDLDAGESHVGWQLQRIGGHRLRRETKTAASEAVLPLPPISQPPATAPHCGCVRGESQALGT